MHDTPRPVARNCRLPAGFAAVLREVASHTLVLMVSSRLVSACLSQRRERMMGGPSPRRPSAGYRLSRIATLDVPPLRVLLAGSRDSRMRCEPAIAHRAYGLHV
jgi:hypothetical protein